VKRGTVSLEEMIAIAVMYDIGFERVFVLLGGTRMNDKINIKI
jgi:hypothetical protein